MQIQDIANKIIPTLRSNGVRKAALFGSHARGTQKQNSDIDILVKLGKKMSLLDYVGLKLDLENLLGKKVDLVQYKTIKPSLRDYILKDETVFYQA